MEPPQTSDAIQIQERAKQIVARILGDAARQAGPGRRLGLVLQGLGFTGRGGETYTSAAVLGWTKAEYAPPATVLVALVLHYGMSLDEYAYGSGLRAALDQLQEAHEQRGAELADLKRDVRFLASTLTNHLLRLPPDQAAALDRIGQPEVEPEPETG